MRGHRESADTGEQTTNKQLQRSISNTVPVNGAFQRVGRSGSVFVIRSKAVVVVVVVV